MAVVCLCDVEENRRADELALPHKALGLEATPVWAWRGRRPMGFRNLGEGKLCDLLHVSSRSCPLTNNHGTAEQSTTAHRHDPDHCCCDAVANGEARDRSTSATGRNQSSFLVLTWQICLLCRHWTLDRWLMPGGESAASSVLPGPPFPRSTVLFERREIVHQSQAITCLTSREACRRLHRPNALIILRNAGADRQARRGFYRQPNGPHLSW